MKSKNIKEVLFYFGLIFIMVMSLNLAIVDCTGMDINFFRLSVFTLITTAVMSIIIAFPITLPAVLVTGIGWLFCRYCTDPLIIKLCIKEAAGFLNWLYGYIMGYNYFEPGYTLMFAILYTILTTLVVSLIVYSGKGAFALILLGTAAMSFFWFAYVEKARWYLALFLFASIMFYSYRVYKKRLREWRAADSSIEHDVGHNWMLCSAIAVAVSLTVSLVLPLNISPVRWTWLNDKAVSLFPFIAEWRNDSLESFSYGYNSRFSLNFAGYNNKKLGGELRLDDSVLMTVKTQGEDTLYLRGAVKDKYFENCWYKSQKDCKEYSPGSSMLLPYGDSVNIYEKTLDITYEKLLTSTIFAPYSVYQVWHSSKRIYADEDSEVYTSKMTMKGESYKVKSMIPYIDVNKLRQTGAKSLEANEFKLYTALAPDIAERVKSLAEEITEGQNNNYDKAKAVEEYLRQNYRYTLKPPVIPPEAEFTEHFLFEGKEGYCTYFATSMAVLLRASGVPCRYVEGFIAGYGGAADRVVRGTDAHAWVEVYFDEYGWVAFEPTPKYPAIEFIKPGSADGVIQRSTAQGTALDDIDTAGISGRHRQLEDGEMVGTGTTYEGGRKKRLNLGNMAALLLLSILFIRFVFMYMVWIMKEVDISRSKGRRFAMNYIGSMLWYLRRAGFIMNQDETLREFLKRVRYNNEENFSDIFNIILILEKIRYSSYELSAGERKELDIFRKKVKSFALKEAGVLQFFISLYILGK